MEAMVLQNVIRATHFTQTHKEDSLKLPVVLLLALSSLEIGAFAQTINLGSADSFALLAGSGITNVSAHTSITVSYTHLDVYKRQGHEYT